MKRVINRQLQMIFGALTLAVGLGQFGSTCGFAQEAFQVGSVSIEGNKNIDSAAIKLQLQHKSGTVTSAQISDEVKSLYRTGFFDQVTVSMVGANTLKYVVVEKPVVRKTFITGNIELKEDELSDVLNFGTKRFLDKARVEALIRAAVAKYQSEGFYDAELEYSVVPVSDGQVDITFSVKEGRRYKIRKVSIRGLKEIDSDDILTEIQTKRYKWWNSWLVGTGRLNKEMLENDKGIVRQYLLDHGYIDGTVSDPAIEKREKGLYLSFDVVEGKQYKFGQIKAEGDLIDGNLEKTLSELKSVSGETFSATSLREDSFKISDRFSDQGFAFANVVPDTQVNKDSNTVDIVFKTEKGQEVYVNKINIKGNEKTYDNVIRRELRIDEQDRYSGTKVKRSQTLLQRLGYFDEVNINTSPTDAKDKVDLDVSVKEASTGSFSIGAGYSTSDGAIFNSKLSENNIMGTGRSASLNLDVGTQRDNIVLSLDDRRLNDSYWSLGGDLERTNRQFSDFDRRLTGGSVAAGYPLEQIFGESFEDINFSTKYEYLEIDIRNVDRESAAPLVLSSEGTSSASSVTPRLVRNTINNPLDPSRGSRQDLSIELAGAGGTEQYYLLEAKNQYYHPMFNLGWGDFVFSWRARVGYGESSDDDPFPLFRRYFPGGINTVRGFKNRSLGPKDDKGNEFGGSKELINNLETIFPLINSAGIKGVVFYDAGQAFDDNESIDIGDLRQAYGFGLRWSSPIGPLRLELGYPIDRQPGEKASNVMFSFGAPF